MELTITNCLPFFSQTSEIISDNLITYSRQRCKRITDKNQMSSQIKLFERTKVYYCFNSKGDTSTYTNKIRWVSFDSVPRNISCEFLLMKRALHKWELNCSSLSTGSAGYGGHFIVEKPRRNAVAVRWCSSTSDKGHHCISEYINIIENIWDELNRHVRRTGANPTNIFTSGKTSLRIKFRVI